MATGEKGKKGVPFSRSPSSQSEAEEKGGCPPCELPRQRGRKQGVFRNPPLSGRPRNGPLEAHRGNEVRAWGNTQRTGRTKGCAGREGARFPLGLPREPFGKGMVASHPLNALGLRRRSSPRPLEEGLLQRGGGPGGFAQGRTWQSRCWSFRCGLSWERPPLGPRSFAASKSLVKEPPLKGKGWGYAIGKPRFPCQEGHRGLLTEKRWVVQAETPRFSC